MNLFVADSVVEIERMLSYLVDRSDMDSVVEDKIEREVEEVQERCGREVVDGIE